jgi:hypothetical protein
MRRRPHPGDQGTESEAAVTNENGLYDPGRAREAVRTRQTTFERGVALALATGMLRDLRQLRTLTEGLRWIANGDDLDQVDRTLSHLREDILRAERIEGRAEGE